MAHEWTQEMAARWTDLNVCRRALGWLTQPETNEMALLELALRQWKKEQNDPEMGQARSRGAT